MNLEQKKYGTYVLFKPFMLSFTGVTATVHVVPRLYLYVKCA